MLHSSLCFYNYTIIRFHLADEVLNPSPAVDGYIRKNAKKYHYLSFNIFDENDVEMFGIMIGQYSSAQYAL